MSHSTDTFALTSAPARPRRQGLARLWRWRGLPWWQRLTRVAAAALLLAVVAYAALPWWLPIGMLKRWVADDMARQMGVQVTIDDMSVGWGKGVEVTGLTVAGPDAFGNEPMLIVERIHTEFAPLRYLFAKRIEAMEVTRPRLLVIVRPDGTTNVAPLRLLEFDVDARHINVHESVVMLDWPGRESRAQLNVTSVRFDAGPRQKFGTIALSAELQQHQGAAPIKLRVDPGESPSVAGRATFSFGDVDLQQLALPELLSLPVSKLGGLCSGSVELRVNSGGVVDQFTLDLSVTDLDAQPTQGPELPVIDRADVNVTATYDPLAPDGRLDILSMRVRLPDALELTGRGVVYKDLIGTSWQAIESLEVNGRVWPARLVEIFTGRSDLAESGVIVTGPVTVDVSAHRRGPDLDMRVGINAIAAAVTLGEDVLKPTGRTLVCELAGTFNERTDVLDVHRGSYITVGGNSVWGSGKVRNARQFAGRLFAEEANGRLSQIIYSIGEVDWSGQAKLTDCQAIIDLLPELAPVLAEATLDGTVTANWFIFDRAGKRLELHVAAPAETRLALGEWFIKPPDQPITLAFAAAIDPAEGTLDDIDIDFTCGQGQFGVDNGWAAFSPAGTETDGPVELAGNITAEQFHAIAACLPLPGDRAADMQSRLRGRYHATYDPSTGTGEADVEIDDLQVLWGAEASEFDRDPSAPGGRVFGSVIVRAERADTGTVMVSLDGDDLEARIVAGDLTRTKLPGDNLRSRVTIQPGEPVTVDLALGGSELTITGRTGPAGEQEARPYRATVTIDDVLLAMLPELAEPVEKINLRGTVSLAGDIAEAADSVDLSADIDARELAFELDSRLVKPLGATLEAFVRASRGEDGSVAVSIERGLLGQVDVAGQVDVHLPAGPDGRLTYRASNGQLLFASDHGESLAEFAPGLADCLVAAAGRAELDWSDDAMSAEVRWRTDLDRLILRHKGKDIHLAGDLAVTVSRAGEDDVIIESLSTDGLEFRIDDYHGFVVADLAGLPHSATGSIHLLVGKVDTKALADWLGGDDEQADKTETTKLSADEMASIDERALAAIEAVRSFVLDSKLQVNVNIDELRFYDSSVEQFYDLKNASIAAAVDRGYVLLELAAGVNSGTLQRQYQTHFGDDEPTVRYEAQLLDVIARENIRPMISLSFPGNTVTGFFNRSDDLEMKLQAVFANSIDWRYPLRPIGQAKTVAIDGITEGQAAPKFITRIFPGLDTARYEYKKMTAFADYGEDGLVINDMVFDGHDYDMYMDGTTDADNVGRYEIGVILLSQPQSAEWNHTYRQGRLPILKFEGRIERGRLYDVTVKYPWPNETLYIVFMKNNYLYRVWLEQKRRQQSR